MKTSFSLYLRLLGSLRPYRTMVGWSILAMVAAASLEPALPALLKPLIDEGLIAKDSAAQWQVPLMLMAAFTAKGLAEYAAKVTSQWVSNRAVTDLRQQVFMHQLSLPVGTHAAQTSARMMSRILYDIPQVGQALSNAWIIVIRDSLIIVGLSAYLFYVAWELTLMILLVAPVVAWVIKVASRKLRGGNKAMQETTGAMTGVVEESLNGVREIKLFGAHAYESRRFAAVSERLFRQTMKTVRVSAANVPLVQVLAAIAVSAVIWFASLLSAQDKLTPGEFVSFVAAMSMLFEPIRRLTSVNAVIQRGLAGAQSIFDLLDLAPEPDSEAATHPAATAPVRGALRFEGVRFRYPQQPSWALDGIDLSIAPGETVALVGASGSGKTTLINLIARFFEPQEGRILLDEQPIADIPLPALRAQLGWVGQHVVLFDDSIAANIAYGAVDADPARIEAAAAHAHVLDFAAGRSEGLASTIGADGRQLSGGQRQRIAIARAFYKDAPVLLLDEATSALDNASEQAIKTALAELRRDRTVLVVAHRLSTVRDADRIVVMAGGRIVETGHHDELAVAGGAYAQLLASGGELQAG